MMTAQEQAAAQEGPSLCLTFHLGGEVFGVDILLVQEIIALPPLARLPRTPRHVSGVMNLRGMVAPVVDLRLRLGLSPRAAEPVVMVLRPSGRLCGAVVDGVSDVLEVVRENMQAAPEMAGGPARAHFLGLVRHDQEMIRLLDMERLLALGEEPSD